MYALDHDAARRSASGDQEYLHRMLYELVDQRGSDLHLTVGVPYSVSRFAHLHRGLVLVTGPTGSGKTTTLASLLDLANRTRSAHIVTIEDPIEFLHPHKRC